MGLSELVGYIFTYGVPIAIVILAVLIVVISVGMSITSIRYIVLGYILIILLVPQASSYGSADGTSTITAYFWVKGTKSFFFSFLDMIIFSTWFFGLVIGSRLSNQPKSYSSPLTSWYLAFGLLFLGHVITAAFDKNPLILEFAQMGVINLLWQGILVSLLFTVIRSERDVKLLIKIIVCCLAARETFGLVRYVFFGGDPLNIYANTGEDLKGLKLTFFDINDHILASVMIGIATWKILVDKVKDREKLLYSILIVIAALIPVLSARRTAQGGLLLAMGMLFFLLPSGRRGSVLIALALVVPLSLASLSLRTVDKSKSMSEKILIDVKTDGKGDPRTSRFYELKTAWKTVKEKPFFGVGPSGQFKVTSSFGLEYHKGNYGFVHSGIGHILLKTGFVGLFIFIGLFVTYIIKVTKGWHFLLPEHKAVAVGCLCGFVSGMPNLFTGPTIPEIRTMLVGGFLFAIPLICIAIGKGKLGESNKSEIGQDLNYFSPTVPKVRSEVV